MSRAESLEGDLDHFVGEQMRAWPGPGLALGIIYKGEVLHRCYGVRDVDTGEAVDSDTLFSIGSCTKAFTTMALGLLVQQGVLDWDRPIRAYLPDFQLWDPVATEQMTLRDLASHRSGLPRHDVMWYGSAFTREELYQRLRYLQPNKPFRYVFQYQNMMYMTAGYLIERVTGQTWEDFVTTHILNPLGMSRSTADMQAVETSANSARAHAGDADNQFTIPYYTLGAAGPAGAIYSNLNDMTTWIQLHLNGGGHGDQSFIDSGILKEMHSAQIIMPPVPEMVWRDYPEIPLNTSGMGWAGLIYRGYSVVRHMGSIDGFVAQVAFVPDEDIGVMIFSNMSGNLLPVILTFDVLDRLLRLEAIDWSGRLLAFKEKTLGQFEGLRQGQQQNRRQDRPASHPLEDYAGQYEHPAYGTMKVVCDDSGLRATRDHLAYTLTHYHYDTFEMANLIMPLPLLVSFGVNTSGDVDELRVPFEAAADPIVFKRTN